MLVKLAVGTFTPSVLIAAAQRLGHLHEHGLEVDEVSVASSPAQFRSLLGGEIDVAVTSPDNVVAYRFVPDNPLGSTFNISIVAAVDRGLGLALYGRPGVTRPDQLRGATLGVDVPTSGFALAMYALADALGVGREEYQLATLGSTPKRLDALTSGKCEATILGAGNELLAEQAGCIPLARVADVCAPYLGTVLAVAAHGPVAAARRLAAALRRTAQVIRSGKVDAEVAAAAQDRLALPDALARRYVTRLRSPAEGLVSDGRVDRAALATIVELRRRYLPPGSDPDPMDNATDMSSGLILHPSVSQS